MAGRQARLITATTQRRMLSHVRHSRYPERDRVMILLSVKAGLRAAEIARLEWSMLLDAWERIAEMIAIPDAIA